MDAAIAVDLSELGGIFTPIEQKHTEGSVDKFPLDSGLVVFIVKLHTTVARGWSHIANVNK